MRKRFQAIVTMIREGATAWDALRFHGVVLRVAKEEFAIWIDDQNSANPYYNNPDWGQALKMASWEWCAEVYPKR